MMGLLCPNNGGFEHKKMPASGTRSVRRASGLVQTLYCQETLVTHSGTTSNFRVCPQNHRASLVICCSGAFPIAIPRIRNRVLRRRADGLEFLE